METQAGHSLGPHMAKGSGESNSGREVSEGHTGTGSVGATRVVGSIRGVWRYKFGSQGFRHSIEATKVSLLAHRVKME